MHASRTKKPTADKQRTAKAEPGREAWTLLLRLLRADESTLLEVWADFDLTSAQGDLLCSLEPGQSAPMVALARSLHCHDSNVTGLVDKLEQRGLIERQSDPKDRRVKLIALTKAGETLRDRLLERLFEPLPFIAVLSVRDKLMLRDIMLRATQAMQVNAATRT
jgi:MarR family transcriptional regulator, organic hydroperoxide resistance regulator